jgi:hypothetical protein
MTRNVKILLAGTTVVILAAAGFLLLQRGSGTTLGQSINAGIDNLAATGIRLLELPLFMLLIPATFLGALAALPVLAWGTKSGRITTARVAAGALVALLLAGMTLVMDRKIGLLQSEIAELRGKLSQERMARLEGLGNLGGTAVASAPVRVEPTMVVPVSATASSQETVKPLPSVVPPPARPSVAAVPVSAPAASQANVPVMKTASGRSALLFDAARVQQDLGLLFGPVGFHPIIHDQATDIVEVDMLNPQVISYMAVVNLRTPGLEIKYGGSLAQKTLTSDFAKANDCQIAINGEAGASPQMNSGLGVWRGNMISAGQVLLKEDPADKRPFLAFDKQNGVSFTAMAAADRGIGADKYNVIWGRLDALIDNHIQTENAPDRQPRTAMGISKDGTRLFLLVVDGRRQQYSIGFTRQEVGLFLQTFGAANGMLCDEGGSSCMWVRKFNGIVNSPSDGMERPTYTHFGIALKPN